jgi:hypothetical protein
MIPVMNASLRRRMLCLALLALPPLAGCSEEDVTHVDLSALPAGRPFYDPAAAEERNAAKAAAAEEAAAEQAAREQAAAQSAAQSAAKQPDLAEGGAPQDPCELYGWVRDRDGYIVINFLDLVLDGHDQELLVEKLLYPEDYEDLDIEWPARIRALDGQKVALTGYMIAIRWEDTTVPEFMLVRDLMSCCFGGAPKPDEWCNVVMDGEGAGFWSYVPVIARGIFRLAGIADEAGYAAGAYSLEGHDVRREL